ncbi:unnamed protein product [Schistosoma mattheei]|uniref:RanBP2-type domain-containing protein n=1 Tax=Schistosoma mattheei TaxID=31246 RepID=A0A3P8E7W8_9TREM|nr:unnamed protein product [Schistosoma mattheei]
MTNFHILAWLVNNDTLGLQIFNSEGKLNEDPYGIVGLLDAIALRCSNNNNNDSIKQYELAVKKWASESPIWATVQELANAVVSDMPPSPPLPTQSDSYRSALSGSSVSLGVGPTSVPKSTWSSQTTTPSGITEQRNSESSHWACSHCTFHNSPDTDECEMCRLPRRG